MNKMFNRVSSIALVMLLAGCKREPITPVPPSMAKRQSPPTQEQPHAVRVDLGPTPAPSAVRPETPNILIITLDTLRFDSTSLDRNGHKCTPFLRQLASSNVTFTRFYSTQDTTSKSHFSLFTGYVGGFTTGLDQPDASIAFQLKKRGYRTFAVIANGILSKKSFRTVMPFSWVINLYDIWQGMSAAQKAAMLPRLDKRIRLYHSEPNDELRYMVFSSANEVLRRVEPRLGGVQPFLGFINLLDSHDPYFPDPRLYSTTWEPKQLSELHFRTLSPELANPALIANAERRKLVEQKIDQARGRAWSTTLDLDDVDLRIYRRRYDAEVRELDGAVRRLFGMLREHDLLRNTIVIITADHGEAFGEERLITHSFENRGNWESTNHIPLVIVFPPSYGVPAAELETPATLADIAPTIYDLLHIDTFAIWKRAEPGNYGRSLLPLIDSKTATTALSRAFIDPLPGEKTAEETEQDQEAMKRLRSLGYIQ